MPLPTSLAHIKRDISGPTLGASLLGERPSLPAEVQAASRAAASRGAGCRGGTAAVSFLPTPSLIASADEKNGTGHSAFVLSFRSRFSLFFPLRFPWWASILAWDTASAKGKVELTTCRLRADSGRELGEMCAAIVT